MARLEYFVSIALSTDTLYLTNADVVRYKTVGGVATAFQPLITGLEFTAQFESLDIARELPATVGVRLANRSLDGGTRGYFDTYLGFGRASGPWDNRIVTVKYGDAASFEGLTTENIYRVQRGTIRHTRNDVSFNATDIRTAHDLDVLTSVFTPSAEDSAIGKYVPVVYGDFTSGVGPSAGGRLRAYVSDKTTGACTIADHEISNLTVWWWNAALELHTLLTVTTQYTEDLSNGGFALVFGGSGIYADAAALQGGLDAGDYFTANCKGVQTGGSRPATLPISGGTGVYELAADIIYDLLTEYGSAVVGDIDTTSFSSANTESDQMLCRAAITSNISVMRLVSAIVRENNLQFYTGSGQYRLNFFEPTAGASAVVTSDLMSDVAQAEYDPQAIYCNRITAFYSPDPLGSSSLGSVQVNDSAAQTEYGAIVNIDVPFVWLASQSDCTLAAQRTLFIRASVGHVVTLEIVPSAISAADLMWRLNLSDIFELTDGWQYDVALCEVRSISRDAVTGRIKIMAFVISQAFPICRWSEGATLSSLPAYWSEGTTLASQYGKWA